MAYIKVDPSTLDKCADKVSAYISEHRSSMYRMDSSVDSLSAVWQGDDYNQVKKEWVEIKAEDSTSEKMLRSVLALETSIRNASVKYKEAQMRAVSRANQLCK